ncbi:hypothetical protein A3A60_02110 [Candidatus Curtissbacteria bacterium RIFCSPLOWO2_01_FULL_42_26]|uniref:Uncharacterized protein n=1 Tax=Candidatus Curtissbacteria bacterium RIFCSPLOWO2_01_FULL_42_26 TaxID=1797729 RepID=A0A1F5HVU4_9BACT|nr:MAG: hypothetical protein A3A60_02110 [Candidatus Curtissbacteria bacterium RIFCSPLOWO2_01_FULL_42_26]
MKRAAYLIFALAFVLTLFLAARITHAQSVPTIISHQGRLLNSSNQPVTSNVSVEFKIYDALTGGTQVWTETQSITPDSLGFYETFLGGVTALPSSLPNPSYLQITVQSETLSPRLQFGVVPFAQKAGMATDLNCPGCVETSDIANSAVTSDKAALMLLHSEANTSSAPPAGVHQEDIQFTVPASNVPRYALVVASTTLNINSGCAAIYFKLDGNLLSTAERTECILGVNSLPLNYRISIPGDGTSHTIKLVLWSQTGFISFGLRSIEAIVVAQ